MSAENTTTRPRQDPGSDSTSSAAGTNRGGPLAGLRVIDIGQLVAGPMVATFLGDLGAEVIKVEHPVHGDAVRVFGTQVEGQSLYWKTLGRNKRCITLDLSKAGGQQVLKRLVSVSDVLTENFRAGTLERWGLGWESLREHNPDLVVVRTSGFGQDGPYSSRPGFGTLAEAMSGFSYVTGEPDGPPQLPQFPLADGLAALVGTVGALASLRHRDAGGGGQWVDNALYEPLMRLLELIVLEQSETGRTRTRTGSRMLDVVPRGCYETSDPGRWVALSGSTPATASRILVAIGRHDLATDRRLQNNADRVVNRELIDDALTEWIGRHTLDEALETLSRADAPVGPVYSSKDILEDPHFRHRKTYVELDDPDLGSILLQNVIPRLSETPGQIRHAGKGKGEDNRWALEELLGLRPEEIQALTSEGVI